VAEQVLGKMKHNSTRALFDYWTRKRGSRRAPARSDIDPADIRGILADTFILTADFVNDIRIRPAGTRICALFARVGVVVTVGKTQGRVVRHIEDGFAIEFMRLQHPDFVEDNITGE
jgi:hypothetical protein